MYPDFEKNVYSASLALRFSPNGQAIEFFNSHSPLHKRPGRSKIVSVTGCYHPLISEPRETNLHRYSLCCLYRACDKRKRSRSDPECI
jgi:hypothetical protein